MNFRIRRGVVPLPSAMALGATRSEEDARFTGQVTAREGRALGVHWAFAPVADVNSNPANPIINVRSYGEDPELVGRMTAAFISGAHDGGLLATVKHYSRARRHRVGQPPAARHHQRRPRAAGPRRAAPVPRRDRGRRGRGDARPHRRACPRPQRDAGHPVRAHRGRAAHRARIPGARGARTPWRCRACARPGRARPRCAPCARARTSCSCTRIRTWPSRPSCARCGRAASPSPASTSPWPGSWPRRSASGSTASASSIRPRWRPWTGRRTSRVPSTWRAGRSPSCANEGGVLPLHAEQPLRLLHLVLSSDARNDAIAGIPEAELAARRIPTQTFVLGPEVAPDTAARILAAAPGFTHVIASAFVRVSAYKGNADMAESHARLLRDLQAAGRPVVLLSFGSPYLLRQVPSVAAYVSAYGAADSSQRAAVAAVFGEYPVSGKVPVSLPGFYAFGDGLQIPRHEMTLRAAAPAEAGFRRTAFGSRPRGGGGGGRARVPGGGPGGGEGRRARAPPALRPSLLRRRCRPRPRRHDVRPGQPHQGHRDHHHGDDPGGRGQARRQQARLLVPARVPWRVQGQGHGLAPPDPLRRASTGGPRSTRS